jgi:hypothetical protein
VLGIVRQSEPPPGTGASHGDVFGLPHQFEAHGPKGSDHSCFGRIDREFRHHAAMVASAMNASMIGDSSDRASFPKVSMWKRMADLTFASASS